jgi:biotin carboxyl carrier protein
MTRYDLSSSDGSFDIVVTSVNDGYRIEMAGDEYFLILKRGPDQNTFVAEVSDKPITVTLVEASSQRVELILDGERLSFQRPAAAIGPSPATTAVPSSQKGLIIAPMPGKVIGVLVRKGEKVRAGDPLVILESMKMETAVRADRDSEVEDILVGEGASVKRGQGLVRLS